jgi:hypothetical protein
MNFIYYLFGYTDETDEILWCEKQRYFKYQVLKEIEKKNFDLKKKKFKNNFHKKLIFKKKINIL